MPNINCTACQFELTYDADPNLRHIQCTQCSELIDISRIHPGLDFNGYHIDEEIGSGCMGTVYKATQVSINRTVCIKVLHSHLANSEEEVRDFFHEVELTAKLDHPDIVMAIDAGNFQGHNYLVMNYIDGQTMKDHLKNEGPFELATALDIFLALAKAFKSIWDSQKMLHNDIKPENIMLTKKLEPRIMDFGVSHQSSGTGQTKVGLIIGTPYYMSPEKTRGQASTCATEIYSLGVSFYEAVSGQRPFGESDPFKTMTLVQNGDYLPLSKHLPGVPKQLALLIKKMMAHKPEQRYSDWNELINDMKALKQVDLSIVQKPKKKKRPQPQVNVIKSKTPEAKTKSTKVKTRKPAPFKKKSQAPILVVVCLVVLIGAIILVSTLSSSTSEKQIAQVKDTQTEKTTAEKKTSHTQEDAKNKQEPDPIKEGKSDDQTIQDIKLVTNESKVLAQTAKAKKTAKNKKLPDVSEAKTKTSKKEKLLLKQEALEEAKLKIKKTQTSKIYRNFTQYRQKLQEDLGKRIHTKNYLDLQKKAHYNFLNLIKVINNNEPDFLKFSQDYMDQAKELLSDKENFNLSHQLLQLQLDLEALVCSSESLKESAPKQYKHWNRLITKIENQLLATIEQPTKKDKASIQQLQKLRGPIEQ